VQRPGKNSERTGEDEVAGAAGRVGQRDRNTARLHMQDGVASTCQPLRQQSHAISRGTNYLHLTINSKMRFGFAEQPSPPSLVG